MHTSTDVAEKLHIKEESVIPGPTKAPVHASRERAGMHKQAENKSDGSGDQAVRKPTVCRRYNPNKPASHFSGWRSSEYRASSVRL